MDFIDPLALEIVRVQPFPSYFGYIMHNNILMMLDLVAVTEYYLLEKSANRKI